MTIAEAMERLSQAMKEEPDYKIGWFHNLSVTIQDCGVDKETADEAARRFLNLAFYAKV